MFLDTLVPMTTNPYDPALPYFPCERLRGYDASPVRFVFQRKLPVTPDRLFQIFDDPASWPIWAMGIGSVRWTSPLPRGPGTTRTVTFWGGMQVYEEFTAWEHGKLMQFDLLGTSQLVWRSFGERYVVTDLGDGHCHLTWTVAYEPTGVFATIHPLLAPIMRLNLGDYMRTLERYCRRAGK